MAAKRLRKALAATAAVAMGAVGVTFAVSGTASADTAWTCSNWRRAMDFQPNIGTVWMDLGEVCLRGLPNGFEASFKRNHNAVNIDTFGPYKLDLWCAKSWKKDGPGNISLRRGDNFTHKFVLPNENSECHLSLWDEGGRFYEAETNDVRRG